MLTPEFEQPLGALYSLFRSIEAQGTEQRSEVLALELRRDAPVARRLAVSDRSPLVYLERVRLAGGAPLALDRVWMPAAIAKPLLHSDFTHTALYDELSERCGVVLDRATERISPVLADSEECRRLDIDAQQPCFAIDRSRITSRPADRMAPDAHPRRSLRVRGAVGPRPPGIERLRPDGERNDGADRPVGPTPLPLRPLKLPPGGRLKRMAATPGYHDHKEDLLRRLRRIEGQVRGLERLIEDETYCIDVLTQVAATTKALQAVAVQLLGEHLRRCVVGAVVETGRHDEPLQDPPPLVGAHSAGAHHAGPPHTERRPWADATPSDATPADATPADPHAARPPQIADADVDALVAEATRAIERLLRT